jgi:hypothetical protein
MGDGFPNGGGGSNGVPGVTSPVVSSGVAFTPFAAGNAMVYIQLNAAAAGSYTITMGPNTGAENTIANAVAMVLGSDELVTLMVPGGWKVVATLVTVTIGQTRVVVI